MDCPTRNEVLLVGRLAAAAVERELPSGDLLTTFRLVVDRPPARRPVSGRPVSVDTLDCVVWTAALRRAAAGWAPGDVLALDGALRRRFWRSTGGPTSRYEVEVSKARRVSRAA